MKTPARFTSIGGQAVIEGVMMRSPHFIAVAVRKPDEKILIRHEVYASWAKKYPVLNKPVFRGVATLLESMVQGIDALSYSATVASEEESKTRQSGVQNSSGEGEKLSKLAIASSIISALLLGMGLFVALPHFLAAFLTSNRFINVSLQSPIFHLFDGILKMLILVAYVYLIALMRDIHRVFQYHGAEHKSIYTFEMGEELIVENARKYSTLHPRCGTSFLLFLVLISIGVFSLVFPIFQLTELSDNKILNHVLIVLIKIVLMLPVAGLSYEFIKMCACRMDQWVFRAMVWPGMVLQKLTTREPTDEQLEVALASLKQVLRLEKDRERESGERSLIEISSLLDLGVVQARVAEFPEAE